MMIAWQWRAWPDPVVDFGRELYTPWQLALGKHLYSDIAYFNGPLSPYFNALIFKIFGVSLSTLIWTNILLTFVIIFLIYRLATSIAGPFAAFVSGLIFVTVFAFGNLVTTGNYNFICPYSHEMLHGMLLAIITIHSLANYLKNNRHLRLAVTGLCLGLIFLTKPEFFIAAAPAVLIPLVLKIYYGKYTFKNILSITAIFLTAVILPVLIAWLLLLRHDSPHQAFINVLGAWPWLTNHQLTSLKFYRWSIGLDEPTARIRILALWLALYSAIFGVPALLAYLLSKHNNYKAGVTLACVLALVFIFITKFNFIVNHYFDLLRPLPVVMIVALIFTLIQVIRSHSRPEVTPTILLRLAGILFAACLLAKILFNCRANHYGFALAMPAAIVTLLIILGGLPRWLENRGRASVILKISACTVLFFIILAMLAVMNQRLKNKIVTTSEGADTFRADIKGAMINEAVNTVLQKTTPNQTLVVIPEGIMINYLARRTNPTPYINFMPPEMIMFGENNMIDALRKNPPDMIILVNRSITEYGFDCFGRDFARDLYSWVTENYTAVQILGSTPFTDDKLGVAILRPKSEK